MLSKTFYQISIHALRKESDQDGAHNVKQAKEFQSTPSVRRATQMDGAIVRLVVISIHALRKESDLLRFLKGCILVISIHALRKESDLFCSTIAACTGYFNPRSP